MPPAGSAIPMDTQREKAFQDYRKKLMEHKEVESRLKDSKFCSIQLCRIISSNFLFLSRNLVLSGFMMLLDGFLIP